MGKKWQKTDPADVNLSDEVRVVEEGEGVNVVYTGTITALYDDEVEMVDTRIRHDQGTWYIRKPKKQKPLTRPTGPPVGTIFRVDRTGETFIGKTELPGLAAKQYHYLDADKGWDLWSDIAEPGDTITLLELTEKGDKKDGGV